MSFSLEVYSVFRVCSVDATYFERVTHTRTHAAKLKNKKKHPPQPPLPNNNNDNNNPPQPSVEGRGPLGGQRAMRAQAHRTAACATLVAAQKSHEPGKGLIWRSVDMRNKTTQAGGREETDHLIQYSHVLCRF